MRLRTFQITASVLVAGCYHLLLISGASQELLLLALAVPLVCFLGIPHGATDHVLHNFEESGVISTRVRLSFLGNYLFKLGAYAVVWFFFPTFSLVVFLVLSAFHFGETQWTIASPSAALPKIIRPILFISWGISLLFIFFFLYPEETLSYTEGLRPSYQPVHFRYFMLNIAGVAFAIWLSVAVNHLEAKEVLQHLVEFALIVFLVWSTNLLTGFAIFFGVWHSMDAISLQLSGLKKAGKFTLMDFTRAALPFSLISIAGIVLVLSAWRYLNIQMSPYALFLVLISLLTLPHQGEVSRFYTKSFNTNLYHAIRKNISAARHR